MPILGILASSKLTAAAGDFESIATVTVGSGGAANVEFTSIGTDWTHLQIRATYKRTTATSNFNTAFVRFNDDSGNNYARHLLYGNGSTVATEAASSTTAGYYGIDTGTSNTNVFCVGVFDILDYRNTNKYKTTRVLSGGDANGSGLVFYASTLWMNTNAITKITLTPSGDNFAQYSHFALYGIKSA